MQKKGKVYLIGAGPGDPGLITVKGNEKLCSSDVVLYDNLSNHELLTGCPKSAELLYVGKQAGLHFLNQEAIIELMIEKALEGKDVARLKGGDPMIFGRGSEEALALKEAGIEFEIVPGVTAGAGATAYSGIPLTHRKMVTQCIFVTAHEAPDKTESQVEWEKIAQMKSTTVVIYMGAKMLPSIVDTLMKHGMPGDMPAALIENGTLPIQKSVVTNIENLVETARNNDFNPPLITVLGPTTSMAQQINWFEERNLFGRRIVVTRARDQAGPFFKMLRDAGAFPLPIPVIRTELAVPDEPVEDILAKDYDWIVFSSENGVRWFFELLKRSGLDARSLGRSKIAVIGDGTARRLKSYGIIPDFLPSDFLSSALVNELTEKHDLKEKKILRVKGYFKQDPLSKGLSDKGAQVDTIAVYDLTSDTPDEKWTEDLIENGADAVIFTSMSTVNNFFEALGEATARDVLTSARPVAIGPVTAGALREHGIDEYATAEKHNLDGLMEVLENELKRQ